MYFFKPSRNSEDMPQGDYHARRRPDL